MEKTESKGSKPAREPKQAGNSRLAAIRIRGPVGISAEKNKVMEMLGLYRKHSCSILDDNPNVRGMLKVVTDQITWGEIDNDSVKLLKEKRGKKEDRAIPLCPPRGGFERKGIKMPYSVGGALGYRGKEIAELIKRMV